MISEKVLIRGGEMVGNKDIEGLKDRRRGKNDKGSRWSHTREF